MTPPVVRVPPAWAQLLGSGSPSLPASHSLLNVPRGNAGDMGCHSLGGPSAGLRSALESEAIQVCPLKPPGHGRLYPRPIAGAHRFLPRCHSAFRRRCCHLDAPESGWACGGL